MSKISKLNIDEKLPIIKNLIESKDPETKPNIVTVYTISKCFNISILESIIILNQYVLKEPDLSNYAIFFICDIVDDSGTCFSKKNNFFNRSKCKRDFRRHSSYIKLWSVWYL